MFALDTNVCIEILRGRMQQIYSFMREHSPSLFGVPAIVEAELRLGAQKGNHPIADEAMVETFLRPFKVLTFDSTCAKEFAKTRAYLESIGKPLAPADTFIAATALAHQARLITNDKAFVRVPGLRVETWDEIDF